jgi:hypothetical protein
MVLSFTEEIKEIDCFEIETFDDYILRLKELYSLELFV